MAEVAHPPTRRAPLGDATRRVKNSQSAIYDTPIPIPLTKHKLSSPTTIPHHDSLRTGGLLQVQDLSLSPVARRHTSKTESPANPRLSAISKEMSSNPNSNRNSQISTASTNASDGRKIKQNIGPWRLGKTLGRGATARVRLARHSQTGQEAAVKIVQKKNAQISQAGSLAALDKAMSISHPRDDGLRRMPIGIEREVAIMKLIEHPNIMKLYDIWENRLEIYLVLEYVERGELFEHIASKGRLEEVEAIKFFRQMMSAVGYCHAINICHRDLKPENILMTAAGDVKIADFGMAALHQGPGYKLRTSCGSPHYAAPELVKGIQYRGDKADIWSLGVILFAMLAGRLPFDVDTPPDKDWIPALLNLIKRGKYDMEDDFSVGARNLIQRLLQVNPRERITMEQLWKHPLVRKYDHLDNLNDDCYLPPNLKDCSRVVTRKSDIDTELLRHLRSMWHTMTEQQLISALLSETANEQKMFYGLFLRYRDLQLENYIPDGVGPSSSDYHHVRPGLSRGYSTMEFASVNGHGRQTSRFTVISNAAETEYSYDPFKASRPQHLGRVHSDRARVTILGTPEVPARRGSRMSSQRSRRIMLQANMTRSSIASSTRSRFMTASASYRRNVSFAHVRRMDTSDMSISSVNRHSSYTEVTDDGGEYLRPVAPSTQYIRSRKQQLAQSQPLLTKDKPARSSLLWHDDVRQLSSSLASDCDKAFNRTSIVSEADTVRTSILSHKAESMDWNLIANATAARSRPPPSTNNKSFDTRSLPRTPTAACPKNPTNAAKRTSDSVEHYERRIMSAPAHPQTQAEAKLASISETKEYAKHPYHNDYGDARHRNISAPEPRHFQEKNTIRYVLPSSPMSPVQVPKPLIVRKVSSTTSNQPQIDRQTHSLPRNHHRDLGLRQKYVADALIHKSNLPKIEEHEQDNSNVDTASARRPAWYSHGSKRSDVSEMSVETFPIRTKSTVPDVANKSFRSRFGQIFRKKKRNIVDNNEYGPAEDISTDGNGAHGQDNHDKSESTLGLRDRQIEPQQSWIAKLFNIKPETRLICFQVSKIKARQEITKLLRGWKKYGIRNVQIDKHRNIVFGRVAAKNYLELKEVDFAAEIMTVVEHGSRSHLSIARFTQEKGSASSFNKVVQTLEAILSNRDVLVEDKIKKDMMVKTLKAAIAASA